MGLYEFFTGRSEKEQDVYENEEMVEQVVSEIKTIATTNVSNAQEEITNAVNAAGDKAQYDARVKRILAQKNILAHILVKTVGEFKGMKPEDVVTYIEGEPKVGIVPVEPDKYKLLNRAIFYVSRLVSSQKERDFVNTNYDDIKQVFSIWICMNMDCNSLSHIHLTKDEMLSPHDWKGNMDLLNIVLVGITNDIPDHEGKYEMHRLIGALLSSELKEQEKLDIIEHEYNIPISNELRENVRIMCNLSIGIEEKATEKTSEKFILNIYKKGYTLDQIADVAETSVEVVEAVIKKKEPAMA